MSDTWRSVALPLSLALLLGIALRLFFIVATPIASASLPGKLSSYNDEAAHSNYTLHLLRFGTLPSQVEPIDQPGALARAHYENYQPPLFYLLHAAVAKLLRLNSDYSIVIAGRLLNTLIGVVLLLLAWRIAGLLQLSVPQASAALAFVSLSGVFLRFTTIVSNDALFWCAVGFAVYYLLKMRAAAPSFIFWLGFGIISAIALWIKLTAVLLLVLPVPLLLSSPSWRKWFGYALGLFAFLLLTLPLWRRNLQEFGAIMPLAAGFGDAGLNVPAASFLIYAVRSFVFPWSEFWHGVVGLLLMLPLLAVVLFGAWKVLSRAQKIPAPLLLFFATACAAFLWLNFRYFQAEARYLFAAWPFLMLLPAAVVQTRIALWSFLAALLLPLALFGLS